MSYLPGLNGSSAAVKCSNAEKKRLLVSEFCSCDSFVGKRPEKAIVLLGQLHLYPPFSLFLVISPERKGHVEILMENVLSKN